MWKLVFSGRKNGTNSYRTKIGLELRDRQVATKLAHKALFGNYVNFLNKGKKETNEGLEKL